MKRDEKEKNQASDGKELTTDSKAACGENSWCRVIFESLHPADELTGSTSKISIDNEPAWVQNVLYELMQQAALAFSINKTEEITPRALGLYFGQQCANLYALGDLLTEPTPETMAAAESNIKLLQEKGSLPEVGDLLEAAEWLKHLFSLVPGYFPRFESALQIAFKTALEQPSYQQAVQFFKGFAKGLSKPGISRDGLARSTTATLIYQSLYFHRREVEKLQNYTELQQFLIRKGVAKNLMGSLKRLQKLCERRGLHLAKRGRPPKS